MREEDGKDEPKYKGDLEESTVPELLTSENDSPFKMNQKQTQTNFGPGMMWEDKLNELKKEMKDHFERTERRFATFEAKEKQLDE